ncbi:hypothetical protein BKA67DRAFT_517900 [Truncatella angustata]|uniref:Uncharacterized protein n=1 Tax=Truncatella angustata TaxID=152316 RepID=A0A9P8UKL5_9PEZI|nr:uncharacterized protein BKA67DRAFT_517900 [Truncatella angustata]KAH6653982.1 hypothetical protein BKA67DRAFT_517900 [Truncatella angustata]KAH8194408.1 hypothetical protein TruAng_011427 [Truncatella angustata]
MPGSSLRDPSPSSSSSGKKGVKKRKQKLTKASDDSGSKKKDKNAKDTGGVFAAVTKHGAKFSDGSPIKDPAPVPESPPSPEQTPEMKPSSPSTIPNHGNPNAGVSPLLDGVTGTSIATSTAPSMSDWTKNHGALAGSPNLISLMGESPPTQPSSYEDQKAHPAWAAQQRNPVNNYAISVSPPTGTRRPLSFQMDHHFPGHDLRSQASSPPGIRRSSMHSPFPQPRVNPPLPHQAQAHFYGTPEVDLDLGPKDGLKAGERGYYFGFDTWPTLHTTHSASSNNVVLAGYEGGLDVYSVSKRGLENLTSLKGLRGGVYNAKILPWNSSSGSAEVYPLVAVVIHGPVLPTQTPDIVETRYDAMGSPKLDGVNTPQSESSQRPIGTAKTTSTIDAYQTTVEIYSLRTNSTVCTLLQAPRIPIKSSIQNPVFRSPPPTGALQVRADNGSVVVSSGTTGECWVFRQFKNTDKVEVEFRCVGKLWTSLQQALKATGDATPEEGRSSSPIPPRQNPQMPVVAIRGRWIAYCPPAPSSQIALNASIGVTIDGRAPGLNTLTSPVLPGESSDVDQPDSNGVMNKIMRETTQEVIQGARWVGKQSLQLWNNYWKQPSPQSQGRPQSVGSPPWSAPFSGRAETAQFPPTYGVSGHAVTKDPGLVSILDLESLNNSSSIHHVTTFKVPLGCSFLSFSPTGLSLFTASTKGDVQTVWDLMRIQHSKSSALQNSPASGNGHLTRVRQIAQFSRMTVARIVDVAWSKPNGERVAMVTERGTVHLLDMPPSAYAWPPPRRRAKAEEPSSAATENPSSAVSMASNVLTSAYGAARPLINHRRRSSSNANATSSLMDHASYGGKVLAAGISHSLGNTATAINQMRQNAENRVSLPMSSQIPGLACVTWITGRRYPTLFVAGDGLVRQFPSKTRKTTTTGKPRVTRGTRYKDFKVKYLPNDVLAPIVKRLIEPEEDLELTNPEFDGGNTLVLNPRPSPGKLDLSPEAAIPHAEIETSAPYQPFHTDRRVALFEYSVEAGQTSLAAVTQLLDETTLEEYSATPRKSKKKQQQGKSAVKSAAWAFGQAMTAVRIDVGIPVAMEDDLSSSSLDEHRALPASAIERVMQRGDNDAQIVITTRRRRGGNRTADGDEDGFFEDDCEVLDFADQRV